MYTANFYMSVFRKGNRGYGRMKSSLQCSGKQLESLSEPLLSNSANNRRSDGGRLLKPVTRDRDSSLSLVASIDFWT